MASASSSSKHMEFLGDDSSTESVDSDSIAGSRIAASDHQQPITSNVTHSGTPVNIINNPNTHHKSHTLAIASRILPPKPWAHKMYISLFPHHFLFKLPFPHIHAQVDIRKFAEHVILLGGLYFGLSRFALIADVSQEFWILRELGSLAVVSTLYMFFTRTKPLPKEGPPTIEHSNPSHKRVSPTPGRDIPTQSSLLWMTSAKDYRSEADDGVLTGLLMGPLIACSMLYGTLISPEPEIQPSLPLVQLQSPFPNTSISPRVSLINGRRGLVQLTTLSSFVLLVHFICSKFFSVYRPTETSPSRARGWRTWTFTGYALEITAIAVFFHALCHVFGLRVWKDLSHFDVAVVSSFYQFSLYVMIRLSHGGFTLGEVALVAQGATILFLETVNVTIFKIWPTATPFVKTSRLATPTLVFQLALIPGSFLVGFLLSPLLVLSRHMSQLRVHRLKRPSERLIQRKALALAFYTFAALIIGGLIGSWTRWCLGGHNPWLWTIFWIAEGKTRPALLVYWAFLGTITVAAWSRQLMRSRKFQRSSMTVPVDPSFAPDAPPSPQASTIGIKHVATDLFDAADRHVPTLSLNARRKSFHTLALVMFTPALAIDPWFTHLSFSVAFAMFVFTEYIRYFALYPFGRVIHLFLNEFVDGKDSGSAILSHFYLLTGVANSLWLEGPWPILNFTGVIVLGIGDSMASIVGRRIGKTRWTAGHPKTVEGSLAFFVTVMIAATLLRIFGVVPPFHLGRYAAVTATSCLLEAVSNQNDNLTIPLYMWSLLVFTKVAVINPT